MPQISNGKNLTEYFGCNVFNDSVMRERLPKPVYQAMKRTRELGKKLEPTIAEVVANAMKDWAIEKGATHFTHWFQPMTGITAEKHDSFINVTGDGKVIMEFSGKELVKGESDASSFPSGGLRATFEARGYTAWDPTSFAFIKDGTLYIPTAFCSYSGEALDKKTPLLRSMEVINKQAMRILRLFGNTTSSHVTTTVGAEQEYFLIDKALYNQRKDLIFAGRTLFGTNAPKGQEMEDHYYGCLKKRVADYMKTLDEELWKLGIPSKTKHNEVAPAQHEMAPIFENTNIAVDHNQLTMECMKKVAEEKGLYCLLNEKPFAGVNGSGKHNNWSMSTDDGMNLLEPGDSPQQNIQFLTFLCAIIKGVDEYSDLLRLSVATAGNDNRLGGHEAPPAIISMYIGEQLEQILDALATGELVKSDAKQQFELGVKTLPKFPKDTTDRNRTSPFAFTGNKFEFRMLGSALSIACPNMMLNTIVAEELKQFADELEGKENFAEELNKILVKTIADHKKVIFNGNNYSDEWLKTAKERGLKNYHNTLDVLPHYVDKKNVDLLSKHNVLEEGEIRSRCEIIIEEYAKTINIEAKTMVHMTKRQIIPAVIKYSKELCDSVVLKQQLAILATAETKLAIKITDLINKLEKSVCNLEDEILKANSIDEYYKQALCFRDKVLPEMAKVREYADALEKIMPETNWPFPSYAQLLFNI